MLPETHNPPASRSSLLLPDVLKNKMLKLNDNLSRIIPTPLGLQSRSGDKLLIILVVYPHNGTAVLKGLMSAIAHTKEAARLCCRGIKGEHIVIVKEEDACAGSAN